MKIQNNWGKLFKKASEDYVVPHVSMSDARKREIEQILRNGNLVLALHHDRMKKQNNLSRHNRTSFFNDIIKEANEPKDLKIEGVLIPKEDVAKILEVKKVEWEILCAYSKLINKIVKRKAISEFDSSLSEEDLTSEAHHATLHAISHYTNSEIKFITFLHHCVSRHLSRVCNKTSGLSHLSTNAVKLKIEYNKLSCEEGATFDKIVERMNISEKEISVLPSILCKVQNMTSLEKEEHEFTVVDESNNNAEPIERDQSILRIVNDLELTDLEKAVLEGFIGSSSGKLGLNSISKNLINPKTQKPYSRMAFTFAWRRIKEKITKVYGEVA